MALANKFDQARMVIEEAFDAFLPETVLLAWSAGKDSTLVLRLVLDVCRDRGLPCPTVLDIDQKDQFEELEAFRDALVAEWGLDLLVVRNASLLDRVGSFGDAVPVECLDLASRQALAAMNFSDSSVVWEPESLACNQLLKTVPINSAIAERGVTAMFTGIRWDEHGARGRETYFSARENPPHTRIHPILHFTERDVWDATFALGIPYCELYRQGYRSIGTKSGTQRPATIPAWEQDLERTGERGGRSLEKEKMMEQLRAWGYM